MQKYNGQLIRQFASSVSGNAASGVAVTVRRKSDNALATLYVDNNTAGATLSNPITTTDKGFFAFYAADGVYTLTFSDNTPQQVIQLQDVAALQDQFDSAVLNAGYIPSGTFAAGATLTQANQVLSDGSSYWRWDGSFPKSVTAGSAPVPTGVGGWIVLSDFALRGDLGVAGSLVPIAGVPASTIAALVSANAGIGQRFINRILSNQVDANMLVVGDSTGNETSEWVYLVAQWLGQQYQTHSVIYRLWNHSTGNYDSPITISSGSGSKKINIYNGSVSGSTCSYFTGSRMSNCLAGQTFDLIIQNYGHNQGTDGVEPFISMRLIESVTAFIQRQPSAEIVLTLQNEDTSYLAFSDRQVRSTATVSSALGLGLIDVRSVFAAKRATGTISEWLADSVHPNATGSAVWANIVKSALSNKAKPVTTMLNPLAEKRPNLAPNSHFYDWIWNAELPAGFIKVNTVTVSKETTIKETLAWSLKAVNGSTSIGEVRCNVDSALQDRSTGTDLLLSVRLFVASGASINAGRVEVTSNLGSISTDPYTEVFGGWVWRQVRVPAALLDGATTLRFSVYVGSANGDTVYIDRVWLGGGMLPHDCQFIPSNLSDYYFPQNVGGVGGAVMSVTGNDISVTSTPAAFAEFFINVSGLVAGEKYKVVWASSNNGTASVYNAANRSGSVTNSGAISALTIEFTAVAPTQSVAFNTFTGTLTMSVNDVAITRV